MDVKALRSKVQELEWAHRELEGIQAFIESNNNDLHCSISTEFYAEGYGDINIQLLRETDPELFALVLKRYEERARMRIERLEQEVVGLTTEA